jgi:hypothetical protein
MQFLAFLESVAAGLTSGNLSEFITLTENLIALGESVFDHKAAVPAVAPSSASTTSAS